MIDASGRPRRAGPPPTRGGSALDVAQWASRGRGQGLAEWRPTCSRAARPKWKWAQDGALLWPRTASGCG